MLYDAVLQSGGSLILFGYGNLAHTFWGGMISVGIFKGIQNNLKIHGSTCI